MTSTITISEKKYPDAKLLFTDTDSLVYHIVAEDVYSDFYMDKVLFDNSDYPESSNVLLVNSRMKRQVIQSHNLLV